MQFIHIPDHLKHFIGQCDAGTHIYRFYGSQDQFCTWFNTVSNICGPEGFLSPRFVSFYVRVSRAAVYKRLKMGILSAFIFHVVDDSCSSKKISYCLVPLSECRFWIEKLELTRF